MLKKFLIGTFALALMLTVVAKTEAFSGVTLKVGSRGADVMELQTLVGATPVDGVFGPMTKAKVMAWQASNGLTADGVFGPMSIAKASAGTTGGTLPAGCTSNTGYSSTTGQSCAATTTTLPAGCMSTVGYSSTTGAKCDGSTTPAGDNGPLVGGAGELMYSSTTTDLESDVKEGATEKVLATKLEADSSDISVGSVKVLFENTSGNGSTRLEKYLDEVVVMLGDKEVGSASADEFSKDGTEYSKSISTTGAIVRDGDKEALYVAVKTLGTVDDETADFDGVITQVRWTDATGALFSDSDSDGSDFGSGAVQTFGFDEANVDDSLEVKANSDNPDDATITVDDNTSTDDVLALAFKLDVDQDSADVSVTTMMLTVTFDGLDTDNDGDITAETSTADSAAEKVIEALMVKVGSEEYELDLDAGSVSINATGDGTATYSADFDVDELVIDSDSTEDVEVYVTFKEQDGNYNEGVVVTVSLADENDIIAETENDEINSVDGSSKTGADLTLSLSSATVSGITWEALEGGAGIELTFKVAAENDSVDVTLAALQAADTVTTTGTVGAPTLSKVSGTATDNGGNSWTVQDGEDATFSLVYTNTGANGTSVRVTMPTIAGQSVSDDKEVSPLVVRNVN